MKRLSYLPPATKLRQGNVFTPVCDSVHRGGGVSVPACTTGHMTRGVSVLGGASLSRGGLSRETPYTETPSYGNERAVRILLECILVLYIHNLCIILFNTSWATFNKSSIHLTFYSF